MSIFTVMGIMGPWQIVVIVLLIVLLFGAKRIPELMKGAGRGVKEFKDAINKDYTEPDKKPEPPKVEE